MDNLKLIALRVGDMKSDNTSSIRKSLKSNTTYYFYQGYEIDDNGIIVSKEGDDAPAPNIYKQPKEEVDYDDYPNLNERDLNINICAIVGENGCGKSALIEILMRIINNLACYLLGEYRTSWAADNLLYVENVKSSLYYLGTTQDFVDEKIKDIEHSFKLEVNDREVKLYEDGKEIEMLFIIDNDLIKPLAPASQLLIFKNLFYTIVSNYSIYAYNTDDFKTENADVKKIGIINKKTQEEFYTTQLKQIEKIKEQIEKIKSGEESEIKSLAVKFLEDKIKDIEPKLTKERVWLTGLFHKNDGYTAPMVITPFRSRGNMDINNESFLAKSRLISLIASNVVKDINNRPISHIALTLYKEKCFESYYDVFDAVGLGETSEEIAELNSLAIIQFYYPNDFQQLLDFKDTEVQYALKYLVYKTIKISRNYSQYGALYRHLSSISNDEYAMSILIANLGSDESHITLKIRQIKQYLKTFLLARLYKNRQYKCGNYYMENGAENQETTLLKNFIETKSYSEDILEQLPPPIFETEIVLIDKKRNEEIPFNTLSSGERQTSYFTSSVVYHLRNLDSAENGNNRGDRVVYHSACLIFEEIELYFHPEMQRRLINDLIHKIKDAKLKHLKSIQMVFVTHSPFILSDIPRKNCLFLKDGEAETRDSNDEDMKTYGANIYDMLRGSFFLKDGAIGEYAKKRINTLINKINYVHFSQKKIEAEKNERSTAMIDVYLEEVKANLKDMKVYLDKNITLEKITQDLKKTAQSEIAIIDEPIIKRKLTEMFVALNIQ